MPTDIPLEILKWSEQQPNWQRDCLRRLFKTGALTPQDLDELTEICKADHGLSNSGKGSPLSKEHLPIGGAVATENVSLVKLTHHNGVNALAPNQTVSFGPGLTIVYGDNGAGKSGYSRVLKLACRSRRPEAILGNVLEGTPLKASATIRARAGDKEADIAWSPGGGPSAVLAQVSVFDSRCVPAYLGDKTDVAFRPFGLDIFDALASACAEVKKRLTISSQSISATLVPMMPGMAAGTRARQLIDGLSPLTKEHHVKSLTDFSDNEIVRLNELRELKYDLTAKDPKKRIAELNSKAGRLDTAADHLAAIDAAVNAAAISSFVIARTRVQSASATLASVQKAAITSDVLAGTGSPQWRAMWNEA